MQPNGARRGKGKGMHARQRIVTWLTGGALLLSLLLNGAVGTAGAQPGCTILASGLADPRGIAVAEDGTVYVTEAGTGGSEPVPTPPGEGPDGPPSTRGLTGQVTRIGPGGAKSVVAGNLPSYAGGGANGPNGIIVAGGALWVTIGGAGPSTPLVTPLPNENTVVRIDPGTGAVTRVADLGAFEKANNPDPYNIDTNPYGLALGADGNLYVADAGGNVLLRVNPTTGQIGVVAVIPGLPVTREELPPGLIPPDAPVANPGRGDLPELDPVPTGVAVAPDGGFYVGLLSGFPFLPGKAKVLRVRADGTLSDAATGLTLVIGVAVGPDNLLYVSQLSTNFGEEEDTPPEPGNVLRVRPDGTKQIVVDGLMLPSGIAFDRAGNLYVVANSVTFGPPGTPPQGQVLRCAGVAAPTMPGLPNTGGGGGRELPVLPLGVLGLVAVTAGLLLVRRRSIAGRTFGHEA